MLLFLCIYPVLIGACAIGMKKNASRDEYGISKNATNAIRGVGMVLIVLAHALETNVSNVTFFYNVSAILGVSACFFVSGYGLFMSFEKKKDNYLRGFLLFKFARMLIPYFILYAVYLIAAAIMGKLPPLAAVGGELIRLEMDGLLLWYFKIQLLMYVFFRIAFTLMKNDRDRLILLAALTVIYYITAWKCGLKSYWYNTCLFFPLGAALGKYREKVLPLIKKPIVTVGAGALTLLMFAVIFFFGRLGMDFIIDGIYMASFIMLLIGIFDRFSGSYVLGWFGKYSMEIYLVHLLLLNIALFGIFNPSNGLTVLLLAAASVALSVPVFMLSNKLLGYVKMLYGKDLEGKTESASSK